MLTGVMETLIVHENRMAGALKESWCTSSNLADVIVRERKMSFRQVHHIVARVVRDSLADGIAPYELTGALVDQAARDIAGTSLGLSDEVVRSALDPRHFVETRVTDGGVGPKQIAKLIDQALAERVGDKRWLEETRERLRAADSELALAVARIVEEPIRL